MASKIKIKILTALMIMTCTETHGKSTEPSWHGNVMSYKDLLDNIMMVLGVNGYGFTNTSPVKDTEHEELHDDTSPANTPPANTPPPPINTLPIANLIGIPSSAGEYPTIMGGIQGAQGTQSTQSIQELIIGGLPWNEVVLPAGTKNVAEAILAVNANIAQTNATLGSQETIIGEFPWNEPALPAGTKNVEEGISDLNANINQTNNILNGKPAIPDSGSVLGTPAVPGLVQAVNTTSALLSDPTNGLEAINTGVVDANINIGKAVAVSESGGKTLFANQAEIAANSNTTNTTLGNKTYGLEAISSAVNTTNSRIGKAVAVVEGGVPTLFQNQVGIVKDITNDITVGNDEITNSIVVAQNAITGAEMGTALGSLGKTGQSIAGSTAETAKNITASQNTVTGSSIETELGSLGATGQSIAMSTAATGDNITAGTAATGDNIATLQNVVTGSPIATPLGSLGGMGQSIADLTAATAADITAAQNTVTGSPSTTLLGSLDGMGQSIAGSTAVTKSNITASQNTMTGSPSTTLLGSLDGMGQSIAMSTAATANNTESALMLVQSAITGAEPRTALGSLGTTGQSVSGSTIATAGTLATAQNNLQGDNPGATLSAIVTSIGDPTKATAPGTSGATIQGTQTAMASAGAVAAKKVDASLTKIEKNTEKTARNIASIKKGGSTSGNPKGPVKNSTSVAKSKPKTSGKK